MGWQQGARSGPRADTYARRQVDRSDDVRGAGLAQLGELLKAVRRRAAFVAVIVAAAGLAALVLTASRPKVYEATSEVWITQSDPVSALLTRTNPEPADAERDFNTRVELIKQPAVADRVRRQLNLRVPVDELLGAVITEVRGTSDIVAIHAADSNARRAAAISNAFARQFVREREQAARSAILRAADRAARELAALSAVEQEDAIGRELARRLRTLQVEAGLQTTGIEVVELARTPSSPRPRHVAALTILAMLLAGLIGVALAAILDVVDRRIADEEDLEPFGLRLLAAVPPARSGAGMDDPAVREALSGLAATLRFPISARELSSVLVTPVGAGDAGRTSVCLGVVRELAEWGVSAIALEADLRQPTFAERLDLPRGPGLSDVVAGRAGLDDALVEVGARTMRPVPQGELADEPTFAVLPAGPVPPNPLTLLTSPAMRQVLERASSMADIVVADAPPAADASDAVTLAGSLDAIVLVVKRGQTRRDALARTLRALEGVPARVLGVVLTNAPRPERLASEPPADADVVPQPR
jgi:succinoglycan biosynthesis transport protein ExoP